MDLSPESWLLIEEPFYFVVYWDWGVDSLLKINYYLGWLSPDNSLICVRLILVDFEPGRGGIRYRYLKRHKGSREVVSRIVVGIASPSLSIFVGPTIPRACHCHVTLPLFQRPSSPIFSRPMIFYHASVAPIGTRPRGPPSLNLSQWPSAMWHAYIAPASRLLLIRNAAYLLEDGFYFVYWFLQGRSLKR